MKRHLQMVVLFGAALAAGGCGKDFTEAMVLGGVTVQPEVLNSGRSTYMQYCYACHGDKGDGQGPAARGYRPAPRDFRDAKFKFAAVPPGTLPHDDDLVRIITGGLDGTPMLPWRVPPARLQAVIQYLKTLSPRWKTEKPGEKIVPGPDTWAAKPEEAVVRGKKVYHGLAQCWACHPSYATKQEMYDAAKELRGQGSADFRADLYYPVAKEADYKDDKHPLLLLPTDFLHHPIKSGKTLPDLYRIIASGIGGTAMPQWKGSLPEEDLWAMAYYVKSLADLRGKKEARELRSKLERQPAFIEPPPPPAPPQHPPGQPIPPGGPSGGQAPEPVKQPTKPEPAKPK